MQQFVGYSLGLIVMRYFPLVLLPISLSFLSHRAWAFPRKQPLIRQSSRSELSQVPSESLQTSDRFWLPAQKLTQDQIFLLHRIEQALAGPDPNRIRAVRGQLLLYVLTLERFLERRSPFPQAICGAGTPGTLPNATQVEASVFGTNLSATQGQVYCYLHGSLQRLTPLLPALNERLKMLSGLAEVRRLPLPPGENVPNAVLPGVYTFERPNLSQPAKPLLAPAPELPPEEPPVIGRTVKSLLAGYRPPPQPAIAPPEKPTALIQSSQALLAQAKQAFPSWAEFVDPKTLDRVQDDYKYALRPYDTQRHSRFLQQPETGAARLLPANAYRIPVNKLHNRLAPTVLERHPFATLSSLPKRPSQLPDSLQNRLAPPAVQRYPFAPFPKRTDAFKPSLALQLEDDRFQIARLGLDYGFIADLGDIPLEQLEQEMCLVEKGTFKPAPIASAEIRQFFLEYQPPDELEALQVDRRRFLSGKVAQLGLNEPLLSQAPVTIDHTYLVRSIQFNLPDAIASNQLLFRTDRRYIDLIIEMQSSDMLVAFRPVSRRADGSYTVLWKVLKQFPDPPIQDLEQYLEWN